MKLPELLCKRCGHTWYPRKNTLPTVCPKCTSPYWNKDRRKNGVCSDAKEQTKP